MGANYDFLNDQQTGDPASDIGGNVGNIAFGRNLWVGIDADLSGSIDAYLGLNMQGSTAEMGIFSPGSGLNISPNTTSVASAPTYGYTPGALNYNYRAVNFVTDGGSTNDIGAGTKAEPDYYVSFLVPLADVAAFLTSTMPTKFNATTPFTENTPVRYVLGTSTQSNSFNQDLGGVNGQVNSSTTWTVLGGFTPTLTASRPIPECSSALLAFIGSVLTFGFKRRR